MNPVEALLFFLSIVGVGIFTINRVLNYIDSDKRLGEINKKNLLPHCSCGCGNKIYIALGDIYDKSTNSWWTKDHYQKLLEGDMT